MVNVKDHEPPPWGRFTFTAILYHSKDFDTSSSDCSSEVHLIEIFKQVEIVCSVFMELFSVIHYIKNIIFFGIK